MEGWVPIPDEIWINGRAYDVEEAMSSPAQDIVLGCAQYAAGKILLNLDTDLECQLKTIIHECFHIFQQDYDGEMDEKLANLVSLFVHNLLSTNRELADCYCTHQEEEED